ncbi:MAG: hypothetical protein ACK559_38290, partial [bacterium]
RGMARDADCGFPRDALRRLSRSGDFAWTRARAGGAGRVHCSVDRDAVPSGSVDTTPRDWL